MTATSYSKEYRPEASLEYELPGLAAVLRPNGQRFEGYAPTGEDGLEGRIERDFSADMADVWLVPGDIGGEKYVELGLDGEARGMMSLGSCG